MIGALLIVFREVIEAGLIVGIVLAATRGIPGRGRWIALGFLAGAWGAGIVAGFAGLISEAFDGMGQELLNAGVLLLAVVMLAWHNAWMASHGRELAADLKAVGHSVGSGQKPLAALAVVVGVAVLREGAEVVLFLYGIVASGTSASSLLAGGLLGLAAGAGLSVVSYLGLVAIPTRHVFSVTTTLITLLAAGLAAQAAQFISAAGVITALDRVMWNTGSVLPEDGIPGRILHSLVGYTANPTELQLVFYVATLAGMLVLMRVAAGRSRRQQPGLAVA